MAQLRNPNGRRPQTRRAPTTMSRGAARITTPPGLARPVDLSQPLVDADHVAALLSVKRKRVYELARRPVDPLPSVHIGGAVRFVLAQVEDWVAAQAST